MTRMTCPARCCAIARRGVAVNSAGPASQMRVNVQLLKQFWTPIAPITRCPYRNLAIDRLPDKQGWSRLDGLGRFSQNRPAERQGHWRCQSTLLPGQERPYQAQFSQAAERISSEVEQFPGRELHHYV